MSFRDTNSGYSSHGSYERYMQHTEQSTMHKMKETYWTTKQVVMKKLGKKEDEHVVASDAELDAKLDFFKSIQKSCLALLNVLENYQDRLYALSQEENAMGRFLKHNGKNDKTRAGKMMASVGKAQSYASQQRLALRVPLVRLYQEVETFRIRAIADTLLTINHMENARTEYRGALMWIKNVSEELDPDTYKQLEKFRKVQAQVRKTKVKFDKLKLDVMQKIDLLSASRSNMFSHVLASYQSTLLHFWNKTSNTMQTVSESFKGYQYYEFNMLKELTEPSKKLIDSTGSEKTEENSIGQSEHDADKSSDDSVSENCACKKCVEHFSTSEDAKTPNDSSILLNTENATNFKHIDITQATLEIEFLQSNLTNIFHDNDVNNIQSLPLIDFNEETHKDNIDIQKPPENNETNIKDLGPDLDFDWNEDEDIEEIKRRQDVELDLDGKSLLTKEGRKEKEQMEKTTLKCSDGLYDKDGESDSLNDIFGMKLGTDDIDKDWKSFFGDDTSLQQPVGPLTNNNYPMDKFSFMPSNLLDTQPPAYSEAISLNQSYTMPPMQMSSKLPMQQPLQPVNNKPGQTKTLKTNKDKKNSDMSSWFNMFADLDPLSNPDAIGRKNDDITGAL